MGPPVADLGAVGELEEPESPTTSVFGNVHPAPGVSAKASAYLELQSAPNGPIVDDLYSVQELNISQIVP